MNGFIRTTSWDFDGLGSKTGASMVGGLSLGGFDALLEETFFSILVGFFLESGAFEGSVEGLVDIAVEEVIVMGGRGVVWEDGGELGDLVFVDHGG